MADAPRSVLVVDDSAVIRTMVIDLMRESGWSADGVPNGREAIVWLGLCEKPPDVIVADLMMPEVDGYELIEFLEGTERLRDVQCVVLTSLAHPPLPAGTRIVHKPLHFEDLLATIQDCLEPKPVGG